jgi:peroxiredoxin family protein
VPKFDDDGGDRKLCIIVSKGTMEWSTAAMVLGNAATGEGIELHVFFTFWGMDAIVDRRMDKLKVSPVANPSMKIPGTDIGMANMLAGLPGMTAFASNMMAKEMEKLEVPPHREFMQMVADSGAHFWACRLTYDMLGLDKSDLWEGVEDVISASDFMELSEGAQIIFI